MIVENTEEKSVYETIKTWIFEHKIKPGARITERMIADELKLSRVPVREAFQRLALEGFIQTTPGKGQCLRVYTEQDIHDLYVLREAIDGMATRYFTIRAEKMEIKYLRMIEEEMKYISEHFNYAYWVEKDAEFHNVIARGARNSRLVQTSKRLVEECLYLVSLASSDAGYKDSDSPPVYLQAVLDEHQHILQAIESNDEARAEQVARKSVQDALVRTMQAFVQNNRQEIVDNGGISESNGRSVSSL